MPKNKVRIVTAASLFDGHDAAINIMRRIMQAKGAEVIHLGHNRSAQEIVEAAIQEDAQGIAVTSYQGGHLEFFKYMYDLLKERGCGHIKIFGGGGGTILPTEIAELEKYGITRIYSPDDGRKMGLEGMIEDVVNQCDFVTVASLNGQLDKLDKQNWKAIAQVITLAEDGKLKKTIDQGPKTKEIPVIGITGTGGAGKSSVTDEIVRRFLMNFKDKTIAVISVDPSRKKTGGALLGDRIRMNSISNPRAYMRSLATRESDKALSKHVQEALDVCKAAQFDFVILESAGVGQSDASILDYCDISMYVMTPEYGAATQLEKINMLDYADVIAINKFDKAGALDALQDVRKQYKRNHNQFTLKDDEVPVIGTIASQFNDAGVNHLFEVLMNKVKEKTGVEFHVKHTSAKNTATKSQIIPPARVRYLAEIAENNEAYDQWVIEQATLASKLYKLTGVQTEVKDNAEIKNLIKQYEKQLHPEAKKLLDNWDELTKKYTGETFAFKVRDKVLDLPFTYKSLSGTSVRKVYLPRYSDWGDILKWQLQENVPGEFPYTAGVFPLKREGEDPTRMFAGEGGPERTNKRFHYVSLGQPAIRLSTAFDSVTLYGQDPDHRPDIYGKVGNSGVSIATVDDIKKLYSGFDLCDPKTSVSMTINGPAPMLLAFFMNAAIDQECEKYIAEHKLDVVGRQTADHRPRYWGELPEGNNGLGLQLLGTSGDKILPAMFMRN